MIVPTKYIPVSNALIGLGAEVLKELTEPMSAAFLWERLRLKPEFGTFERFVLAVDLLFILNAVVMDQGQLRRAR